jgi:transposase InsO family protein
MTRYRFVEAESSRYPVAQVCRIAQVSRAAYYAWQATPVSPRATADAALTAQIRAIHAASGGQYGVPRVVAELRAQGVDVGKKRVARLMKAAGLRGRRPPRWVRTTTPEPTPPAIPDRVHGEFTAPAPDVLWVGDITYVRTWEGWLYLATVIDVFSRRVLGWAVADHMRAALVGEALDLAVATRGGRVAGVIFHSDRGSQYTAAEFRARCDANGVKQSMGTTGVCWDNALAESFFATYKLEL